MSLVVETGAGLANAESYASVSEADAYHTNRGNSVWTDLDTDVKEGLLRKATDYMLGAYRGRWKGYRLNTTQSLDWPRQAVPLFDVYLSGYVGAISNSSVPNDVKNACCELAWLAKSSDLAPVQTQRVSSKSVGPISVTYEPGSSVQPRYTAIEGMLLPYLSGTAGAHKVARS